MPISSPQMTTIFGLSVLAIANLPWLVWRCRAAAPMPVRRQQPQHDGRNRAYPDQDQQDRNRDNRRLQPLLGHPGKYAERPAPKGTYRPPILPNRYDKRQNTAGDQRQPQILRRVRDTSGRDAGHLL